MGLGARVISLQHVTVRSLRPPLPVPCQLTHCRQIVVGQAAIKSSLKQTAVAVQSTGRNACCGGLASPFIMFEWFTLGTALVLRGTRLSDPTYQQKYCARSFAFPFPYLEDSIMDRAKETACLHANPVHDIFLCFPVHSYPLSSVLPGWSA